MNHTIVRLIAAVSLLWFAGCEVPAASNTVEVTIENISYLDIDDAGRLIYALASVNTGSCQQGPCSPNPCGEDASAAAQGRTACIGKGDQHQCVCPPGQFQDNMNGMGNCSPETTCAPGNRTCGARAGFPTRGTAGEGCMEGNIVCDCSPGYLGPFCGECDTEMGYFRDGEGFCSLPSSNEPPCRDGEGTEAFAKLLEDAEEELGHAPVELELKSATMEVVPGSAAGVRSWGYLFSGPVTLFVQTISGFPSDAGVAEIPPDEVGVDEPLEFDMKITRGRLSSDPQFKSGDFAIGISAPTDRQLTEQMFKADLKLILEFNAY